MSNGSSAIAPKLYQRAFDIISNEIRSGQLPAGERITEVGLALRLGISRAPIRQALALLQSNGFIEKTRGTGFEVSDIGLLNTHVTNTSLPEQTLQFASRSSWTIIYDEVEKDIVSRAAFADWHVNEVSLGRHYGVSRTVARDVLARLQQRGIIRKDAKGKWLAPVLDEKRISDLYELRWILEPIALEKAAASLPNGLVQQMHRSLLQVSVTKKDDNYPTTLDALEQDLHITLLSYCNNPTLIDAVSLPQAILATNHFLFDWTNDMYDSEPFLPEHLVVFESLLDGDVHGAKVALAEHLLISQQRSRQRITNVPPHLQLDAISYLTRR